jgi:hypothetical protein
MDTLLSGYLLATALVALTKPASAVPCGINECDDLDLCCDATSLCCFSSCPAPSPSWCRTASAPTGFPTGFPDFTFTPTAEFGASSVDITFFLPIIIIGSIIAFGLLLLGIYKYNNPDKIVCKSQQTQFAEAVVAAQQDANQVIDKLAQQKLDQIEAQHMKEQLAKATSHVNWKLFISYCQYDGQQLASQIRSDIIASLPRVGPAQVFLDVDSLKSIADLEYLVQTSTAILVILSPLYLTRPNCLRELSQAALNKKPVIIIKTMGDFPISLFTEQIEKIPGLIIGALTADQKQSFQVWLQNDFLTIIARDYSLTLGSNAKRGYFLDLFDGVLAMDA